VTPISDARLEAQIRHKRDYIVKFGKVAAAREAAEEQLKALLELRTRRERDGELLAALKSIRDGERQTHNRVWGWTGTEMRNIADAAIRRYEETKP